MLLKKGLLIAIFILIFSFNAYSADEPGLSAASAVLINADTLQVIYEKDAYSRRSMASTTKIMTSIIAVESGRLSQTVTAGNILTEGSSIGLKQGYKMSLETLVWGMLLESGNDAACLTASFLCESEEKFADLMNIKAAEIGMKDTNFVTASGLDSKEHYSTAYDMALLGAYAIKNPVFREMCSTRIKTVSFFEPQISMTFTNHNKLLGSADGVFGIKTGFTKKSGRCLVTCCERDNITLVAVTLNAGDDWNDHLKLYDYGFSCSKAENALLRIPESIRIYGGESSVLPIDSQCSNLIYSYSGEKGEIRQKIYLPAFLYAPIDKGEIIGKAELLMNGRVIASSELIAGESIRAIAPTEDDSILERLYFKFKKRLLN